MGREFVQGSAAAPGAGGDGRGALPVHLIGNVNLDIVMGPVQPWPKPGTETIVERQEVRVGGRRGWRAGAAGYGHALPAARPHRRRRLRPVRTPRLGPAGAHLERYAPTAYSVGLGHPDGERTFLPASVTWPARRGAIAAELEHAGAGLVLVCGYFLLPPLRHGGGLRADAAGRQAGHRVLFDSGWPSEGFTEPCASS